MRGLRWLKNKLGFGEYLCTNIFCQNVFDLEDKYCMKYCLRCESRNIRKLYGKQKNLYIFLIRISRWKISKIIEAYFETRQNRKEKKEKKIFMSYRVPSTHMLFDADTGREYPYSEKDKIAKERKSVYISDAEAKVEAEKNKEHIKKKDDERFKKEVHEKIARVLARK